MLSKQTYNVLSERTMPCRPPLCIKTSYNKWKNERSALIKTNVKGRSGYQRIGGGRSAHTLVLVFDS